MGELATPSLSYVIFVLGIKWWVSQKIKILRDLCTASHLHNDLG